MTSKGAISTKRLRQRLGLRGVATPLRAASPAWPLVSRAEARSTQLRLDDLPKRFRQAASRPDADVAESQA